MQQCISIDIIIPMIIIYDDDKQSLIPISINNTIDIKNTINIKITNDISSH